MKSFSRMITFIITLLLFWQIISDVSAENPSVFQFYILKHGITINLPKNWQIIESQLMDQIDTNTEILTGIGQGNNEILIAANFYDGRTKTPSARARISARIKQTASQSDILAMSQGDLDAGADQGYQLALTAMMKSGDQITKITPLQDV